MVVGRLRTNLKTRESGLHAEANFSTTEGSPVARKAFAKILPIGRLNSDNGTLPQL
jgi:hypothetical protein